MQETLIYEVAICIAMLVISVIHLMPAIGVLGVERLNSLYAIAIDDVNLELLMRHRAILFAILGVLFAYAAFEPKLQPFAFFAAFVSIASFFHLALKLGGLALDGVNGALRRVFIVDIVAATALVIAVMAYTLKS